MPPIESLPFLRWADIIDILLISFLIHRLLMLFRGTATLHVTAALVLLWLLTGVAHQFELVLSSRFLEATATVAVLVIVVAFRDEIRDVLVQASPARLFFGRPTARPEARRVEAVAEATFRLAERRTGALLVFQNRRRLGEIVRDGIPFGAQISLPVLETVFAKDSPVHDGAAVIRGTKIERVGTILPLTRRRDLPSEYGTRHRAAVGLSEVSDAVIVVVSEERGEVSIVHRGEVRQVDDPAGLRRALCGHLGWESDDAQTRRLRREFLLQLGGFVATTAAVSAYWAAYFGRESSVTSVTVRVDFPGLGDGLELIASSAQQVEVQVRGRPPLIEDLKARPEQVSASVNLGGRGPGIGQVVQLGPEYVKLPVGLTVERITPGRLVLDIDRQVVRELPVEVVFAVLPPEGTEVEVRPARVRVSGPLSAVDEVQSVRTRAIVLETTDAERTVSAELVALPDDVRLERGQPTQVKVTIRLPAVEPSPVEGPDAPPEAP